MSRFFEISGMVAWGAAALFVFPGPGLFLALSWLSERRS